MKQFFLGWELGTECSTCKANSACHVEFSNLFPNQILLHREPPETGLRLYVTNRSTKLMQIFSFNSQHNENVYHTVYSKFEQKIPLLDRLLMSQQNIDFWTTEKWIVSVSNVELQNCFQSNLFARLLLKREYCWKFDTIALITSVYQMLSWKRIVDFPYDFNGDLQFPLTLPFAHQKAYENGIWQRRG